MKIMFCINTLFQVMVAIQLKRTVYREDDADIVVTDRTGEQAGFAMRITDEKIFRHVYFCNSKEFAYPHGVVKKTFHYLAGNLFPHMVLHQLDEITGMYDLFLYHNDSIDCQVLYDRLIKKNKSMECVRFEEGYSVYIPLEHTYTKGNRLRNFLGKRNLRELTGFVYMFNPELLQVEMPYGIKRIDKINSDDHAMLEMLNRIFAYDPCKSINQKYIVFEEAYATDGERIEDYELISFVADLVGKDNLLVKLHPRTEINRFLELGIETDTRKIPWEVIQMNEDMGEKVLISIASGSILASKLYFDEDVHSILMYKCLKSKPDKVSKEFEMYLERFGSLFDQNLFIPENKEKLKSYLTAGGI